MDVQLGRTPDGPVTLDFDSTGVEVYGRDKPGAGVNYQGHPFLPASITVDQARLGTTPDDHASRGCIFNRQ